MSNLDEFKAALKSEGVKIKNIRVKVECIESGNIEKDFDCGIDERKAEKLEDALIDRYDTSKVVIYQSVTV